MIDKLKINGFIRYSVKSSFNKNKIDVFNPDYFNYRLELFKSITLKSFQEQTDKDFSLYLFHSDEMPNNYKKIFADLESENKFLKNIFVNKIDDCSLPKNICKDSMLSFRVDNDDAVPNDYIAKLRKYARPEFFGFVITFPKILVIQRTGQNEYLFENRNYLQTSIGMAFVDKLKTVMDIGNHLEVADKYPIISEPGSGGLMILNGTNVANKFWHKAGTTSYDSIKNILGNMNHPEYNLNILKIIEMPFFYRTKKLFLKK